MKLFGQRLIASLFCFVLILSVLNSASGSGSAPAAVSFQYGEAFEQELLKKMKEVFNQDSTTDSLEAAIRDSVGSRLVDLLPDTSASSASPASPASKDADFIRELLSGMEPVDSQGKALGTDMGLAVYLPEKSVSVRSKLKDINIVRGADPGKSRIAMEFDLLTVSVQKMQLGFSYAPNGTTSKADRKFHPAKISLSGNALEPISVQASVRAVKVDFYLDLPERGTLVTLRDLKVLVPKNQVAIKISTDFSGILIKTKEGGSIRLPVSEALRSQILAKFEAMAASLIPDYINNPAFQESVLAPVREQINQAIGQGQGIAFDIPLPMYSAHGAAQRLEKLVRLAKRDGADPQAGSPRLLPGEMVFTIDPSAQATPKDLFAKLITSLTNDFSEFFLGWQAGRNRLHGIFRSGGVKKNIADIKTHEAFEEINRSRIIEKLAVAFYLQRGLRAPYLEVLKGNLGGHQDMLSNMDGEDSQIESLFGNTKVEDAALAKACDILKVRLEKMAQAFGPDLKGLSATDVAFIRKIKDVDLWVDNFAVRVVPSQAGTALSKDTLAVDFYLRDFETNPKPAVQFETPLPKVKNNDVVINLELDPINRFFESLYAADPSLFKLRSGMVVSSAPTVKGVKGTNTFVMDVPIQNHWNPVRRTYITKINFEVKILEQGRMVEVKATGVKKISVKGPNNWLLGPVNWVLFALINPKSLTSTFVGKVVFDVTDAGDTLTAKIPVTNLGKLNYRVRSAQVSEQDSQLLRIEGVRY